MTVNANADYELQNATLTEAKISHPSTERGQLTM